jgi:hypothetical protein
MQNPTDALSRIRQNLAQRSASELVDLLLELLDQVDETTRRRFWDQVAPSGLATADLRYPSAEAFLTEVETFVDKADAGEYYDEQAAEYYGEDPADRDYHVQRGYIDKYDVEWHAGLTTLRTLLTEAGSYYQADQFQVAADAYERLLGLMLPDRGYDLFGVDDPLSEVGFYEHGLVEHFFVALRQVATMEAERSASRAVAFLEALAGSYRDYVQQLIQVCQADPARGFGAALRRYLEERAEEWTAPSTQEQNWPQTPFLLKVLIRLERALEGPMAVIDLCARFRKQYPDLYMPLLEGYAAQEAWSQVLEFGSEALDLPPRPRDYRYIGPAQLPNLDPNVVHEHVARAQEQLGDLPAAFAHRRAAFERIPEFETYQGALDLAQRIGEAEAQQFTAEVVAHLRPDTRERLLLCQVYLYDGDYDSAFQVVQDLTGYGALDELKLVAKAHLLAALHGQQVEGEYLPNIKTDLDTSTANEEARFLRDYLPMPDLDPTQRQAYVQRAEHLYTAILETHIDAGSKRYETAAYYCALRAEIALHTGQVKAFEAWYENLLARYRRKRSLRGILDAKVQPVLQKTRKGLD